MKQETAYKGRLIPVLFSFAHLLASTILSKNLSLSGLISGISLLVLTTFQCGCQKTASPSEFSHLTKGEITLELKLDDSYPQTCISTISVFSFNDDSLGRLDSYQLIKNINDGKIRIGSSGGRKRIYVCCNLNLANAEVAQISTASDFEKLSFALENAHREFPFMLGMTTTETGGSVNSTILLKPMVSEIVLNSIRCDFNGMAYEGENITDCKVYLINVNAQCHLYDSTYSARRMINVGMLNIDEVWKFKEPDIIYNEINGEIGSEWRTEKICMLCFQNFCEEESPGSPFTRMVVEGKVQGETYYWPITINRTNYGEGVRNNTRHVIDLTIRRKGGLDPDEELKIEDCAIMMEMKEWEEKDGYVVRF